MTHIDELARLGTSTWLDDLSRERLDSGNLRELLDTKSIVGVTTNPAIFAAAMSSGTSYDADIAALKEKSATADDAVYSLAIDDVRNACDLFTEIYESTDGRDGRVSIEVDPRISADAEATLAQARELWSKVNRPNLMIKIPATDGSLPAISDALAEGISVNVTLIFSVERYAQVIAAYKEGIQRAAEAGKDISTIHSVASFFVSRLDTEVDKRLELNGSDEALALRGKAGVANAQRAYALFLKEFKDNGSDLPSGAHPQRPLWASTGVKNPDYPATLYVSELAGPETVNTMPEKTIDAVLAQGNLHGDTLTEASDDAEKVWAQLEAVGIDFADVFTVLEQEGVDKFVDAWEELLASMTDRLS
ncbi:transaldolase [Corynebacterium sp. HMSC076G08]|uniref:transaldolase n=1 Tax=unclassified Corynebacterium TaxID=2624378 RepID=UPI0008A17EA6|nr:MULTISPECIES: transaldolase [unclassified Corynebacterium]OFK69448.1 transaldolase [Corynebacterium sp. HMSC076G08]OFN35547.1 transaldolase [Corynebacterium sp. HMSC072A04]OFQ55293.1 transaldolase [Corynebacterium sp. HMSC074H12]